MSPLRGGVNRRGVRTRILTTFNAPGSPKAPEAGELSYKWSALTGARRRFAIDYKLISLCDLSQWTLVN